MNSAVIDMKRSSASLPLVIKGAVHVGNSLRRNLEAYDNLMAAMGELVQNSIDLTLGGAKSILIEIDFDTGTANYFDNGLGLSQEKLVAALESICDSSKTVDKFGRFGLGMVCPISIFSFFLMKTAVQGCSYVEVKFDSQKIFGSPTNPEFPARQLGSVFHDDNRTPGSKSWSSKVWWRTSLEMTGLTGDKVKRRFDLADFRQTIQAQYSVKMAKLGTNIKVVLKENGKTEEMTFSAKEYAGKQLPVWEKEIPGIGKAHIRFHLTPHGYKGSLNIGFGSSDNPSRVPINKMLRSTLMTSLDVRSSAALRSGMFQGEVVCDGIEMKVDRRSFSDNDALVGLVVAIDDWYQDVGRDYYENEKLNRAATRYQAIGLEVIERFSSDILDVKNSPFAQVLAAATYGSVGKGHSPSPKNTLVSGAGMVGKAASPDKKGGGGGKGGGTASGSTRPNHHPGIAIGPEGSFRKVVKGHSTGFHIQVGEFEGTKLWLFDPASLCLQINNTHPLFEKVESSDTKLRELYSNIVLTSFRIASLPRESHFAAQMFAELHMDDWVCNVLASKRST